MSEPKLYLETLCEHGRMESHGTMKGARGEELSAPGHICEGGERYEVTVSHMLSTVRAGVESGTIKGGVRFFDVDVAQMMRVDESGFYIVVGPVDGGGDR